MDRDLRALSRPVGSPRRHRVGQQTDFAFTVAEVIATFAERKAAMPTMKALHAANRRSVGCFWTGKLIKGDIDPLWHVGSIE